MERPGRQSVMKEMKAELTTERRWVKPPAVRGGGGERGDGVVDVAEEEALADEVRHGDGRGGRPGKVESDGARWEEVEQNP
ncbi:hypothetical protein EE612_057623 [Oryza sativa]|nr:hypothetical protein EE612_057623 [Oryza sativa]